MSGRSRPAGASLGRTSLAKATSSSRVIRGCCAFQRNEAMADVEMEGRREALDAFAQAGANAPPPAVIPAAGLMGDGAGLRVIGAQKIAVPREEPKVLARLA